MTFCKWLDTFVEEKGIDVDRAFEVYDDGGTWHRIPVGAVIEFVKELDDPNTQEKIKTNFVKIDFYNGDVYHFLEFMAKGMANIPHMFSESEE